METKFQHFFKNQVQTITLCFQTPMNNFSRNPSFTDDLYKYLQKIQLNNHSRSSHTLSQTQFPFSFLRREDTLSPKLLKVTLISNCHSFKKTIRRERVNNLTEYRQPISEKNSYLKVSYLIVLFDSLINRK